MNRPIKFRAWDNGKKEWLMGYELESLGGFSLFGECMLFEEWSQILNQFLFEKNGHKQDDLVVMQFTGLKDKNGKEIYEGDVLKINYSTHSTPAFKWQNKNRKRFYQVLFLDSKWVIFHEKRTNLLSLKMAKSIEIIGNIYENPELLNP